MDKHARRTFFRVCACDMLQVRPLIPAWGTILGRIMRSLLAFVCLGFFPPWKGVYTVGYVRAWESNTARTKGAPLKATAAQFGDSFQPGWCLNCQKWFFHNKLRHRNHYTNEKIGNLITLVQFNLHYCIGKITLIDKLFYQVILSYIVDHVRIRYKHEYEHEYRTLKSSWGIQELIAS